MDPFRDEAYTPRYHSFCRASAQPLCRIGRSTRRIRSSLTGRTRPHLLGFTPFNRHSQGISHVSPGCLAPSGSSLFRQRPRARVLLKALRCSVDRTYYSTAPAPCQGEARHFSTSNQKSVISHKFIILWVKIFSKIYSKSLQNGRIGQENTGYPLSLLVKAPKEGVFFLFPLAL